MIGLMIGMALACKSGNGDRLCQDTHFSGPN
jgi:hypothetical protein